jgi:hypothetical protein
MAPSSLTLELLGREGLDHGVGHLVSMTPEKTHGSISIGIEIR